MTHPSPQEASMLLILGELRGDVKSVLSNQQATSARINALEDTTDARFVKLEQRVKTLEEVKLRVGAIAVGVGLASGVFGAQSWPTFLKIIGAM